jgi:hypothetical protein
VPGDYEVEGLRWKKLRKSSTDGRTPMNISQACAKIAMVVMELGVKCTRWMAYASSTWTKNSESGGTNPIIRKGRRTMILLMLRGLGNASLARRMVLGVTSTLARST